jgi:hypothetical protein
MDPYDPGTKSLVERANGYFGSSLVPGRQFASLADFDARLQHWLSLVANTRKHAVSRMNLAQALGLDRATMAMLPPVALVAGTTVTTRLGSDHNASMGGSTYSVHSDASVPPCLIWP